MKEINLVVGSLSNVIGGHDFRMKNKVVCVENGRPVIRGGRGHIVSICTYRNDKEIMVKNISEDLKKPYLMCTIDDLEEIK